MLNLYYNGKSYRVSQKNATYIVNEKGFDLIDRMFILEEVKENKELSMYDAGIGACINSKGDVVDYNTSILEKLREWVSTELKLDGYEHQQILDKIDLLASLETPQFTPGQEIECSHTGKEWDWFKEKFTKMVGVNKDLYGVEGEESWYRFARPIEDKIDHDQVKENIRVMDEQDGVKIEPELPDFDLLQDSLRTARENNTVPYVVISQLLELLKLK